jgi:hypothetical protein
MQINQLEIADTPFGKFVGCAVMSEKQHIAEYDLSNLDLRITLDGKELDPRKVFSAWERATAGTGEITQAQAPQIPDDPNTEYVRISRTDLDYIISAAERAYDDTWSGDSMVSDAFDSAISSIESALHNAVRETLVECVSENSVSDINDDARSHLDDALELLRRL